MAKLSNKDVKYFFTSSRVNIVSQADYLQQSEGRWILICTSGNYTYQDKLLAYKYTIEGDYSLMISIH